MYQNINIIGPTRTLTHQGLFTEQPKAEIGGWFETFGITCVSYNTIFCSHICVLNRGDRMGRREVNVEKGR